MIHKITIESLEMMNEEYSGLCLCCGEICWGDTEPDAENYFCDSCEEDAVMGPVHLIYQGNVKIVNKREEESIQW